MEEMWINMFHSELAGTHKDTLSSCRNCDTESIWGQEQFQLSHALVISNT